MFSSQTLELLGFETALIPPHVFVPNFPQRHGIRVAPTAHAMKLLGLRLRAFGMSSLYHISLLVLVIEGRKISGCKWKTKTCQKKVVQLLIGLPCLRHTFVQFL